MPQDFRPRGAREVRQAAQAFLEMRDRIRHHVEQRTTMLAGVSHDLRTVLTRFKLELALLGDSPEVEALRNDVNEMQHMLEDYLAFAKGDGGEEAAPTNVGELLEEVHEETQHFGTPIEIRMRQPSGDLVLPLKRQAFKRAVDQPRHQRRPLRRLRRHPRRRRGGLAAHRGGRRRAGHSAGRARQRVPAVLPARPRAATRTPATPASAWPSPATSPAATAATSRSASRSMGGLRATVRVPLCRRVSNRRPPLGTCRSGMISTTSPARVGEAQRQHLRHHLADLARREVHDRGDLAADQRLGL